MSYAVTDIKELKKILADHEKRIQKIESVHSKPENKKKCVGESKTRGDLLIELKTEGFFKQPKYIGEIAEKCTEKAYYTVSTDLTKPLQKSVVLAYFAE